MSHALVGQPIVLGIVLNRDPRRQLKAKVVVSMFALDGKRIRLDEHDAIPRRPEKRPMNPTPAHFSWNDIEAEQINHSISRRFITADNVTIARFELKKGGVVPEHSHLNEQVSTVLSGTLSFHF
ncbi:MAG: hypothetical protein ABI442_13045, partial [Gemmatimonadaceae bacterium]